MATPQVTATLKGNHVLLVLRNTSGKTIKSQKVDATQIVRDQLEAVIEGPMGQKIAGGWRKIGGAFAIAVK